MTDIGPQTRSQQSGEIDIAGRWCKWNIYCCSPRISPQHNEWGCDHLVHLLNVHKQHYQQTSDILETVQIFELLLIQEFGFVGKYHGQDTEMEGK